MPSEILIRRGDRINAYCVAKEGCPERGYDVHHVDVLGVEDSIVARYFSSQFPNNGKVD